MLGVAVMLLLVMPVAFACLYSGEVPEAVAVNSVMRSIDTATSTVNVPAMASVIVQRAVPVRVSGSPSPVELKVVVAAEGLLIVMPVPPACHVHA